MSGTIIRTPLVWITVVSVLAVSLGGCTVTKELTFDKRRASQRDFVSPREATNLLEGRVATVHAWADSSAFSLVQIDANRITVRRDSTLWTDIDDGRRWSVPTNRVAMITYQRDHAAGDGFAIGLAAGLPAGALAALFVWWDAGLPGEYDGHWSTGVSAYIGGIFIGIVTFGASILLGTIIGASSDGGETVIVVNGFTPPDDCVSGMDFPCGYK